MTQAPNNRLHRYYALDALRVIALVVLIFYHIGMFFVWDWEWHIKSPIQYRWLQDVMILTNQWRMSLLFLISSMVLVAVWKHSYAQGKSILNTTVVLMNSRITRLLIPLIFGMYVVVAPQVFIEWTQKGLIEMPFLEFYWHYINPNSALLEQRQSVIGLLTWNHLWFLPYLLVYLVLLLILLPFLCWSLSKAGRLGNNLTLFNIVVCGTTSLVWLTLRADFPTTHDLLNDWYSHAKYGVVVVVGSVIMLNPALWGNIMKARRFYLFIAVSMYLLIVLDRHGLLGDTGVWMESVNGFRIVVALVVVINHWAWIGAILGYGKRYLDKPSEWFMRLNGGVYTYYIVHQTLIVMVAFWLRDSALPTWLTFTIILAFSVVGCLLTYEVVKRLPLIRLFFGVFNKSEGAVFRLPGIKKAV